MEPNDALRERFDTINVTELAEMKKRQEPETLTLDFKLMSADGEPSNDDRENLKIALSGFANAAGGLLLWGVSTKDEKKVERHAFWAVVPIRDKARALKRLHELTGEATNDPVSGVVHMAIEVEGGCVIKTLVPASDGGPHRTSGKAGSYYRRVADRFVHMEHYEIADMFGRRVRPRLVAVFGPLQDNIGRMGQSEAHVFPLKRTFGIRNDGRGIARFPAFEFRVGRNDVVRLLPATFGLTWMPRAGGDLERPYLFSGGADIVVYPSATIEIGDLQFRGRTDEGGAINGPAWVKYRLFAEGVSPVEGMMELGPLELWEAAERHREAARWSGQKGLG